MIGIYFSYSNNAKSIYLFLYSTNWQEKAMRGSEKQRKELKRKEERTKKEKQTAQQKELRK